MRMSIIGGTWLPDNSVSLGWVAEILQAMGCDTDGGVPAEVVTQAFRKCVEEDITGQAVSAAFSPQQRKPVR